MPAIPHPRSSIRIEYRPVTSLQSRAQSDCVLGEGGPWTCDAHVYTGPLAETMACGAILGHNGREGSCLLKILFNNRGLLGRVLYCMHSTGRGDDSRTKSTYWLTLRSIIVGSRRNLYCWKAWKVAFPMKLVSLSLAAVLQSSVPDKVRGGAGPIFPKCNQCPDELGPQSRPRSGIL